MRAPPSATGSSGTSAPPPTAGGVAEMLQTLLAYGQGAGIENRWLVLDGDSHFFTITKRIHNMLHGDRGRRRSPGRRGARPLRGGAEPEPRRHAHSRCPRATWCCCTTHRPPGWRSPFAAGVCTSRGAATSGATHPASSRPRPGTSCGRSWRPWSCSCSRAGSTRRHWVDPARLLVIPPSIDPFSTKNIELSRRHRGSGPGHRRPGDRRRAGRGATSSGATADRAPSGPPSATGLLDGAAPPLRRPPDRAGEPVGPAQGHARSHGGLRADGGPTSRVTGPT